MSVSGRITVYWVKCICGLHPTVIVLSAENCDVVRHKQRYEDSDMIIFFLSDWTRYILVGCAGDSLVVLVFWLKRRNDEELYLTYLYSTLIHLLNHLCHWCEVVCGEKKKKSGYVLVVLHLSFVFHTKQVRRYQLVFFNKPGTWLCFLCVWNCSIDTQIQLK